MKHFAITAFVCLALVALLSSCSTTNDPSRRTAPNLLTAKEKAGGWKLLFDGKSTTGWRGYKKQAMTDMGWKVEDGLLKKVAGERGGDIITAQTFHDFEFSWEWKVAPGGNNGVKYFVTEERASAPGHEYQMIDDLGHPDGKLGARRQTASFYDVLPPAADKKLNPPGEWNASRIVVRGNHVEHWLNGAKVLEYELGSDAVKAGLAKSKFKDVPKFGEKIDGHLLLTDHGDECFFRNLKVRELSAR